ncbi:MAG: acyl-CoA thioesterase [Chitinophagaceae bacterium]
MNKNPSSLYTIRFSDCDPFGHLNNGRYIDYFLNAREDHLKENYELTLKNFYLQGVSWFVNSHEITYLRPADYNETVKISSALIQIAPESLLVEFQMTDEQHTHLKSLLWTKFIPVSVKTGKRQNHDDAFMEFAKSIEVADFDPAKGYKERLKEIIMKK